MCDKTMASIARNLAEALSDFAHERSDDSRKRLAELHTDLCREWRAEQRERIDQDQQQAQLEV